MSPEFWDRLITVGGPVTIIALISIFLNYKLTLLWIEKTQSAMLEVTKALGEVTEALRRLNGKVRSIDRGEERRA